MKKPDRFAKRRKKRLKNGTDLRFSRIDLNLLSSNLVVSLDSIKRNNNYIQKNNFNNQNFKSIPINRRFLKKLHSTNRINNYYSMVR